eukprot:2917762-Amphidinium_carterae.1
MPAWARAEVSPKKSQDTEAGRTFGIAKSYSAPRNAQHSAGAVASSAHTSGEGVFCASPAGIRRHIENLRMCNAYRCQ